MKGNFGLGTIAERLKGKTMEWPHGVPSTECLEDLVAMMKAGSCVGVFSQGQMNSRCITESPQPAALTSLGVQ